MFIREENWLMMGGQKKRGGCTTQQATEAVSNAVKPLSNVIEKNK